MKASNLLISALLAFTALAVTQPAYAVVTFSSLADSEFELLDAGGMAISLTPGGTTSTFTLGTGTASLDADLQVPAAPVPFTVGTTFFQTSEVSGSAEAPFGLGDASVLNDGFIELENPSLTPATALFRFEYSWDADVTRDSVINEAASASPFFHLDGFAPSGGETLAIDSGGGFMPVADWLVHPMIGLPIGTGPLSDSATGSMEVIAAVTVPGAPSPTTSRLEAFSVITDSFGDAVHVPEPSRAVLTLAGCVGLILIRRRP